MIEDIRVISKETEKKIDKIESFLKETSALIILLTFFIISIFGINESVIFDIVGYVFVSCIVLLATFSFKEFRLYNFCSFWVLIYKWIFNKW